MSNWRDDFSEEQLKEAFFSYMLVDSIDISGNNGDYFACIDDEMGESEVYLTVDGQMIDSAECNCGYDGSGYYCKHIAMVMFELFGTDREFEKYGKYFGD